MQAQRPRHIANRIKMDIAFFIIKPPLINNLVCAYITLANFSLKVNSEKFSTYNSGIRCVEGVTMPFYPRIRNLREDKDMTQAQMGDILSCSQRVYSNYERGDIDIPTVTLTKIADFHKVSVDYLLGRTNNPNVNK